MLKNVKFIKIKISESQLQKLKFGYTQKENPPKNERILNVTKSIFNLL